MNNTQNQTIPTPEQVATQMESSARISKELDEKEALEKQARKVILPLLDEKDLEGAYQIYRKVYGKDIGFQALKDLIYNYNSMAGYSNRSSSPKSKYIVEIWEEFQNFETFLEHELKDQIRRKKEAQAQQEHDEYVRSLKGADRYLAYINNKDPVIDSIVRTFWDTETFKELNGFWNFSIKEFDKLLTFWFSVAENAQRYKDIELSVITEFLDTKPTCLQFGSGICADGERVMRTIISTCYQFDKYIDNKKEALESGPYQNKE